MSTRMRRPALLLAIAFPCATLAGASGCGDDGSSSASDAGVDADLTPPPPAENYQRDILRYDLSLDLAAKTGSATLTIAGDSSTGLSLEKGNLVISSITSPYGDLQSLDLGSIVHIGVPAGGETRELTIDYSFTSHDNFDGWDEGAELSFLWPTYCENLFPCKSDPADGATFSLQVSGASGTAVFPAEIPDDAPSYMPAIAVGNFSEQSLGTTAAGTEVKIWFEPGQDADISAGTSHLLEVFEFLETTYGPYRFGSTVGSVSADWGGGDYGGMEHHPFWHVSSGSLDSEEVHAHEAAHGWFGNGVRIGCWEDFVLSEGVVTYMAARALGESGVDLWADYDCQLRSICNGAGNTQALLESCGVIDIIDHPLWSGVPYQKGAQFLRECAALIGEAEVDEVLAAFYSENFGQGARMEDLIDALKAVGESEAIDAAADDWLRQSACPARVEALCVD